MSSAYTENSEICARFYQLTVDSRAAGQFVLQHSMPKKGERVLFVGSMFDIAQALIDIGLDVTLMDYSPEMVAIAARFFPDREVFVGDLKNFSVTTPFDRIYVVGRVFTHMITDDELRSAIQSCKRALIPGGGFFIDNYEDSRIRETDYFNGEIVGEGGGDLIKRTSSTELVSKSPYIVLWKARYQGRFRSRPFDFTDSMEHRAWSRPEIASILNDAKFDVLSQGDNFDETSFYTMAKAAS